MYYIYMHIFQKIYLTLPTLLVIYRVYIYIFPKFLVISPMHPQIAQSIAHCRPNPAAGNLGFRLRFV